ncbi:MAG: thioredoxin [Pseudomonadota bacterium]|nr:MAG: thioredoxin [Pseudomonadota bacterium]
MSTFPILDQFNFHHTLESTRGVVIVFFAREGCGSCRHWRGVLADYRVQRAHALQIFEVDAVRDSALIREFGVYHLPALYLYRDGHFHAELRAEAHPAKLHAAIETQLIAPAEEAP